MSKQLLYPLFVLSSLGWASYLQSQTTFTARLTGRNEVMPVLSRGSAEISAVLTDSVLEVSGVFKNLGTPVDTTIAGGAHIHRGYAGQNGPVMFPLTLSLDAGMTSGTIDAANNTFTLSATQVQALTERRFYLNIHTLSHPGGEIRGQLLPQSESYFSTNLFGSNEVPPVLSDGSGALALELSGNQLVVTGSFSNLDSDFNPNAAGGSHLHTGLAGSGGPITIPLNATVDSTMRSGVYEAANNTFTLSSEQLASLQSRRLYANVHSMEYPAGELRGQVVSGDALAVFRAHLSGSNEVPVVTSKATGMVIAEVLKDSIVQASGSFNNLSAAFTAAHFHTALAGRNGPVNFPLTADTGASMQSGSFEVADNMTTYTPAQMDMLFSRGMYANVHSTNYPGGETRGQLLPEGQAVFNAFMSSAYEIPEVFSGATGDLKAELNGNTLTVSGSVNDLGAPIATNVAGGAHIHLGLAGMTGGIVFSLNVTPDANNLGGVFRAEDNVFVLDSAQVENLEARRYYANVHSTAHPSGELRGQLVHQATTYFAAPLSGTSEPANVNSNGMGMVILEANNGGHALLSGSFSDLSSPFNGGAHIHLNVAGRNGPVVVPLNNSTGAGVFSSTFEVEENEFDMTPGFLDSLMMRMYYVNVHSNDWPGGEIRGQLMPLATQYFTTTLSGMNEVPPNSSGGTGQLKLEMTGNKLIVHGSFDGLESNFNGGAHLHLAMPCMNGPVVFPLDVTVDAGNTGGVILASDNMFTLDSTQIAQLGQGNFYANIHSVDMPAGEIRGQILKETNSFPEPETNITAPATGTVINVEGNPNTSFTASWLPGFDQDANMQVYIWQLSTDPDFSDIIFQQNVCTATTFSTNFSTLDSLLASLGLNAGDSITLYHRALGSDAAVFNTGTSGSIVLVRGMLTQQQGVDLELDISANATGYNIYVDVTYTVTVTNTGSETATGVSVAAGLPTGMVHTANFVTKGSYNLFFERWEVGTLAPGESATLTLVLFPLVGNIDITNFVQVLTQDQADVDSSPGNDVGQTPDEDDEAAVTVLGPVPPPSGGITADLELFASVENNQYDIYEDVFYTLTLVNNGPDDAAGINVQAGLPQGMVHTSNFATHGQYNLFFERWEVGLLAVGDTATLELALFPLVDNVDLTNFFEVLSSNQNDPDSSPGNGVCCTPQEDDESVVTVTASFNSPNPPTDNLIIPVVNKDMPYGKVFPVPASSFVKVQMTSVADQPGTEFAIFDQTGRLVEMQRTDIAEGANELEVNISHFVPGIYFIKVPGIETMRFVKI